MTTTNYLGGLRKEFHHIKVPREGGEEYEPAMVILNEKKLGQSFIIPIDAFWKYMDPRDNKEAVTEDRIEFKKLGMKILFNMRTTLAGSPARGMAQADWTCLPVAEAINKAGSIMLCVAFNLAKIMQMMDLVINPACAFQLLMFIQDGLDELKNMPPAPEDDIVGTAGEVTVFESGKAIGTRELEVTETDLKV